MEFPIVPAVAGGVATVILIILIILFSCMWKRRNTLRKKKQDFKSYVERVFNDSLKEKGEVSLNEAYRKVSYPDFPETSDISYTLNRSETAAYDEVPYDDLTQGTLSHDTSYKNGTLPRDANSTKINLEDGCTRKESTPKKPIAESQDRTHDKDSLPLNQPDVLSGTAIVDRGKLTPQTSQASDDVFILPQNEEHEQILNNNDSERVNIKSMKYSAVNISFEQGDEGITRL